MVWISLSNLTHKKAKDLNRDLENVNLPHAISEIINEVYPKAVKFVEYKNIEEDILFLEVQNPIWIGELNKHKEEIKEKINLGRSRVIKNIKFVLIKR